MTIWVRVSLDRRGLTYTSRYIGTHKNLLRLVFAQSIQLSNIVLANLRWLTRLGGFGSGWQLALLSNPMFGAKQLSLTGIRISVVELTPNIKLRSQVLGLRSQENL